LRENESLELLDSKEMRYVANLIPDLELSLSLSDELEGP